MNKEFPKSWSDVKLDQYIEYMQLKDDDFETKFDYEFEAFQILMDDIFDFELDDISVTQFMEIKNKFNFRFQEPSNKINKNIKDFRYKGVDDLTFGEFIDLEYYFTTDMLTYLPNICAIMWRKFKVDEFGNEHLELYSSFKMKERIETFKLLPVTNVFGVVEEYAKFKEHFLETFHEHFEQPSEDNGEYDELLTEEDKIEIEREESLKQFTWEGILYKLANGDITKYEYILGLPLIFIFNQLSFNRAMNL